MKVSQSIVMKINSVLDPLCVKVTGLQTTKRKETHHYCNPLPIMHLFNRTDHKNKPLVKQFLCENHKFLTFLTGSMRNTNTFLKVEDAPRQPSLLSKAIFCPHRIYTILFIEIT